MVQKNGRQGEKVEDAKKKKIKGNLSKLQCEKKTKGREKPIASSSKRPLMSLFMISRPA